MKAIRTVSVREALAAAALAVLVMQAMADSYVWDIAPGTVGAGNGTVTGGSGAWSTTNGNWTADAGANNVAWPGSGTSNAAVFTGAPGTVSLDAAGVAANALTFESGPYLIQNATLTLNGAAPSVTVASNVSATVSSAITGTAGLVKAGPGGLTLLNSCGYSGTTVIQGGAISLTSATVAFDAGQLPNSAIVVNGGGALIVSNDWVTKSTQSVTVNSGGTLTAAEYVTGRETDRNYMNVLNLTDATVNGKGAFRMGNGVGTLTVNAGAAGSEISAGVHLVRNLGNGVGLFAVADGSAAADLTVSGVIGDTINFPGAPVVKAGLGTMKLTGANTYVGRTVVSNGTLLVNGSLAAASTGLVYSAATLGGTGLLAGAFTLSSGALLAPGDAATNGGVGTITFGDLVLSNVWYQCDYGTNMADRVCVTNALTLPDQMTVNLFSVGGAPLPSEVVLFTAKTLARTPDFSQWTVGGCQGAVAVRDGTNVVLTVTGGNPGTAYFWDLNGATAGAGGPAPSGLWNGSAQIWNTDFYGGSGSFTNQTTLNDDLFFAAGSDAAGSYTVDLAGGTRDARTLTFKDGSASLSNGTVNLAATGVLAVNAGQAVIRAKMSGAGTSLTKTGPGVLSISGTNTCSGGLIISQGQVTMNHTNANSTGQITLGDARSGDMPLTLCVNVFEKNVPNAITVSAAGAGPVAINGTAIRVNFSGPITLNRAVTLGGDTTDRHGYSGRISGNVGVLTINSDRITFDQNAANANTFTGRVVIASGKLLQLFALYGLSASHAVEANGTLQLAVNGGTFPIGTLTGNGFVRTYPGIVYAGTLSIGGDNGSGTFSGKLVEGVPQSVLSVIKTGSGVQTLAGTNTYTGATAVNAGTLRLGVADAVTNSAITVAAGAKLDLGGQTQHVKALTGAGGTLRVNIAADGLSSDQVIVSGDLNLSGLALEVAGTERLLVTRKYLIASSAGGVRTGLFTSTNLDKKWMVMYLPAGAQLELRSGTLISLF